MLYNFDEAVDRRNTDAIKWDACREAVPLWVADMDLVCAQPIIDALRQRVGQKIYGYTNTLTPTYLNAVTGWMARRFDWQAKGEWIRNADGVIQAISGLIYLLSKPGDSIIIQQPVYGPFAMEIQTQDRVIRNSELIFQDGSYRMDFADLEAAFADEKVKGMILCNPHNPVGRVWAEQELTTLLALAKENKKWIISDEIHCDIIRADQKNIPLLKLAEKIDYTDFVYACTSPSKGFNLAGMNLANAFIPNQTTRNGWDRYVRATLHVANANPFSISAMEAAYSDGGAEWLDQANAYIDANIAYLQSFLKKHLPLAFMAPCQGTYLTWVNFDAYEKDADAFQSALLKAGVCLNAGSGFGATQNWQRINVACPRSQLQAGLEIIDKLVNG